MRDGRPEMIEYSDLPDELGERREPDGGLELWAGSIAHPHDRAHVRRRGSRSAVAGCRSIARSSRSHTWTGAGTRSSRSEPNAVKFEQFIFDALPLARRAVVVETDRAIEFEPLKNATGPASPETVRARMSASTPDGSNGGSAGSARSGRTPVQPIEISPLVALDAADLAGRVDQGMAVTGPVVLS